MSDKYVHYDLNNIINKYFDNLNTRSNFTENYNRCINENKFDRFSQSCFQGNINIVNDLIQLNYPVPEDRRIDKSLGYAMDGACMGGNLEIVKLLIKKNITPGHSSEELAIEEGFPEIYKLVYDYTQELYTKMFTKMFTKRLQRENKNKTIT